MTEAPILSRPSAGSGGPLTGRVVAHPHAARHVPWERDAVARFAARMLDGERLFPCVFGVDALRRGTLRFAFVPAPPADSDVLAEALGEFVAMAPELGRRTSLVAFFEPTGDERGLDGWREYFWKLLQGLHDGDPASWPDDIPRGTEDAKWEFCFAGMPMFVVVNTPAHQRRASRYFEYFCITFQPRFVFDDIAESTPQGVRARRVIRRRLSRYDSIPATPLLGSFGSPGNREWTQYFLDDDNTPLAEGARCPLRIAGHHEAAEEAR